jgi:hypothetical protein
MITTDAVTAWLKLPAGEAASQAAVIAQVTASVVSFVDSLGTIRRVPDQDDPTVLVWAPETDLGALMLASRLWRRRNSPAGIEAFSEVGGASYVSRYDSDVARLLRIDAFLKPAVG